MFEGDTCAKKIPLMLMGGKAEGLACTDPGARTPVSVSGYLCLYRTVHRSHEKKCGCILNINVFLLFVNQIQATISQIGQISGVSQTFPKKKAEKTVNL